MLSNFITNLTSNFTSKKQYRVLLLGWPGKTSFVYWNKLKEEIPSIPTIGFNVETIQVNNIEYTLWDVGGCDKIKRLIVHYFEATDAFIYFLPTVEQELLIYSLENLQEILEFYELPKIPIVFFFVQRDLPEAQTLSYKQVLDLSMPLLSSIKDRPYIIQFGSAFGAKGQEAIGQKEIFIWLETVLEDFNKKNKNRQLSPQSTNSDVILLNKQ